MDFGSIPFIIWFLPVFVLIYYLIPSVQGKKAAIIVGSIFFYGVSCLAWLPYLLGLTVCAIAAAFWVRKKGKPALIISVLAFTAFLVWNKASDQLMPGVSFVIFTILALLVDTYRKPTEKSLLDLVSYILFFPKLLSGPIARLEQMETRKVRLMGEKPTRNGVNIEYGAACFIIGLGYKVLLANQLSGLWREIQTIGLPSVSTQLAWMGVIGYSLQLYFDFAGYSEMSNGLSLMMGFECPANFNLPYISGSITEFWRRWHISLSGWFRDYIYIPLGGNRCSAGRQMLNMLAVWALTGIWHGANWNFICWGLYYFVLLVIEKNFLMKYLKKGKVWPHIYTLFLVVLGWGLFTCNAPGAPLGLLLSRLFIPQGGVSALYFLRNYAVLLVVCCVCSTQLPGRFWQWCKGKAPLRAALCGVCFVLCTAYVVAATGSTALYANF